MVKKESRRVKTLSGFMKWAAQFNDGQYLFRGVSNEEYEIEASASRRLGENDSNPVKLLKINKEMIDDARLQGHDLKNGQRLSDLELLAELQHYGAATCLIDFTYSAQIALWMACWQRSKWDVNGKVFAVRSDDPVRFKKVTSDSVREKLDCFFKMNERGGYPLYQWQPKQQNNRIIAQQSIFLFGGAKIAAEAECIILKSSKKTILTSLEKSSGIVEARMFPDFGGFARLRAHDREYIEPNVEGYLRRGFEAHQEGRLDDAIDYYNEVISLHPDDRALATAYYRRGFAYEDKKQYDKAIEDFTGMLNILPNNPYAHFARGINYAFSDEYVKAIEDFSKVVTKIADDALAYYHRGITWLHLKKWENAEIDLTTARDKFFDIIAAFHHTHNGNVVDLERKVGVRLPKNIVSMLTEQLKQDTTPLK